MAERATIYPKAIFLSEVAATCDALTMLVRKKNDAYGDSIFQSPLLTPELPPATAILVRMSDKVGRLRNLEQNDVDTVGESYTDTLKDLAGYAVLFRILVKRNEGVDLDFDRTDPMMRGKQSMSTWECIAREFTIVNQYAHDMFEPLPEETFDKLDDLQGVLRCLIDNAIKEIRITEGYHAATAQFARLLAAGCVLLLTHMAGPPH